MDFRLTVPSLANNCWPATPQELVNDAFEKTRGQLQDLTGIILSATEPDPEDRDKLWVKLDAPNGYPVGQFVYGAGSWIWPVDGDSRKYSVSERMFWVGDPTDVPTLWGGLSGAATLTTGPFWEIDTDFEGRVPIGVGTIPNSDPAIVVSTRQKVGDGSVELTADDVASHTHKLNADASILDGDNIKVVGSGSGGAGLFLGGSGPASQSLSVEPSLPPSGTQTKVSVVQPSFGGYWLKRTIRKFITP